MTSRTKNATSSWRVFELTVTYLDDLDKIEHCTALAVRLGGDQEALFFGASL